MFVEQDDRERGEPGGEGGRVSGAAAGGQRAENRKKARAEGAAAAALSPGQTQLPVQAGREGEQIITLEKHTHTLNFTLHTPDLRSES